MAETAAKTQGKGVVLSTMLVVVLMVLLGGFVWSSYSYLAVKKEMEFLSTPQGQQELVKKEIENVVKAVSKLIVLPKDQQPTLATIQDAAALAKDQPFFQVAKNGDKLLLYADKAIIYDHVKNILVNVGPVYNSGAQGDQQVSNQSLADGTPGRLNIDVRNGSKTVGVARTLADELATKPEYAIQEVTSAAKSTYSKTILVDLTGKDVSALEKELGTKAVKELPSGEASSSADVLIIVGSSK